MAWEHAQVREFAERSEVEVVARDAAGAAHAPVTVWAVVVEGQPYLRSFRGAEGQWYQRVREQPEAEVELGDRRLPVRCVPVTDPEVRGEVGAAYQHKYAGSPYVADMVSADSAATTLRLDPR